MNVHDPAPGVVNAATATPASTDDALPIYEVARQLGIAQHVLRTWENRFPQLQPIRGPSGRRLYRPDDVQLLRRISDMLYVRHLSLGEVQRILAGMPGTRDIAGEATTPAVTPQVAEPGPAARPSVVEITDVQVEEIETVTVIHQQVSAAPPATPPASEEKAQAEQEDMSAPAAGPAPVAVTVEDVAPEAAAPEVPAPPVASSPEGEAPATLPSQFEAASASSAAAPEGSDATESVEEDGTPADAVPDAAPQVAAQADGAEEEEPPLEQLVMLELERLRAENVVLRDHLRGVLVELEALREMVPV
ncbi:MerR family transcriptional regulator [Gluconacetobacter entanii]|uniref:Transcriptional regulator n=1 Tax=Gluconacetobacter entanii TaxID=108528 RepID=A0A318Q457_9PROT|nr:MerR family transcriptional regulator [Gluconacetobacter entanii]MCE2577225.1 MerR family transcriptional regulator [Komagataeibacter sp. FNDCR1]PYD63743.1 transcriptional regulator [Gluconacetobacter entanii]